MFACFYLFIYKYLPSIVVKEFTGVCVEGMLGSSAIARIKMPP